MSIEQYVVEQSEHVPHGIQYRGYAVYSENYDGAPDADHQVSIIGYGLTVREAFDDYFEQLYQYGYSDDKRPATAAA